MREIRPVFGWWDYCPIRNMFRSKDGWITVERAEEIGKIIKYDGTYNRTPATGKGESNDHQE